MHDDDRIEAVMRALGDGSEDGHMWAAVLIRYADNAPSSFRPELFPYAEPIVRRAWRVANGIPEDGPDHGVAAGKPSPVTPLQGEDAKALDEGPNSEGKRGS